MPRYTNEQLYDALRQADAAGDVKSATRLAEYIRQRKSQTPSPDPTALNPNVFQDLQKQEKHADDDSLSAFMGGAILSMAEAGGKLRDLLHMGGGDEEQMKKAVQIVQGLSAAHPIATTAGQVAGSAVPAIAGWEAGGALMPEIAGGKIATTAGRILKTAAGSAGSQLATGEIPSLKTTGGDILLDQLTRGTFSAVSKAMNKTRDIIGRPSESVLSAAARIGINPSLAVASGGKGAQIIEDILAKTPGGAGVVKQHYEQEFRGIDDFIERIKERHGSQGDSTQLGQNIINGLNNFTRQFTDKSENLYDKLWQAIPRNTRVEMPQFTKKLEEISGRYADDPELAALLNDPFVEKLLGAVRAKSGSVDQETADLVYSLTGELQKPGAAINSVKALRTRIGASFDRPELLSRSIEDADRQALYSALTNDLESAAEKAGPKAKQAWKNANNYWAAGRTRIDNFLNPLARLQTADAVYKNLFGAEGKAAKAIDPGRAAALMKSLPENIKGEVISEVIQRLGEARSGAQGAAGGEFSPATFLTNWNKLPSGAKKVLFADAATRADMDALATYSDAFKELAKSRNLSQTGQYVALSSLLTGALFHPLYGSLALGGVVGGSRLTAKLMSSPRFIKWMRQVSESQGDSDLAKRVGKLIAIYWNHPHLQDDISSYVDQQSGE
ncbi:TPA: hypothetical protein ACNVDX_003639 [Citrobacter gillenii]